MSTEGETVDKISDEEYLSALRSLHDDDEDDEENVAIFVESRKGKTILQYNGHRYRKSYKSKHGDRWNCSVNKQCGAFLYLNDNDEIIMLNQEHSHSRAARVENVDIDQQGKFII